MGWLRSIGGHCQSGIAADDRRGMVPVTKLIAPNGRHVIHPGNDQNEILSQHIVERFDWRLRVQSPFREKDGWTV
jgi:hypothetical protein